jgi:hypothetical protein
MFHSAFETALQRRPLSHHFKQGEVSHSLQLSLLPAAPAVQLSCFGMQPDGSGTLWVAVVTEAELKALVRTVLACKCFS